MNLNKKKVLVSSLAICLLAILSIGTLAWFNDSETVSNEFYVASSNDENPDDIFSVDVYEEIDEDGDGVADDLDGDGIPDRIEDGGYTFEDVVPGATLGKKVCVENTGRYEQWVRLTIKFSTIDAWYALQDGNTADGPIKLVNITSNWIFGGLDYTTEDAYVYTYYLDKALTAGETVTAFTEVAIPAGLEQVDFYNIRNEEIKLEVTADAIQFELGSSAKEAFENLENDN